MSFDEFTLSTSDLFDVLSNTSTHTIAMNSTNNAASSSSTTVTASTLATASTSSPLAAAVAAANRLPNTEAYMRARSFSPQPMSGELPDPAQMREEEAESNHSNRAAPLLDSSTIQLLASARDAQFRSVSELVAEQRHALMCADSVACAQLAEREAALSAIIVAQLDQLRRLDTDVIMEPARLGAWQFLCSDLSLQLQQLQLLEDELRATAAQQSCAALMALVIQSQPFPSVVAKGRRLLDLADGVVVQLLCASTATNVAEFSPVVAALVPHSVEKPAVGSTTLITDVVPTPLPAPPPPYAANTAQYLTDHVVPLDTTTLMARLPLTFASGTRKSLASVRCALHVRAVDGTTILCESNSSDATIVTTNDSQWAAAAGSLLAWDLFRASDLATSWPRFVNALQRMFINASRAHVPKNGNARVLSPFDISYIHLRFFQGLQRANHASVAAFWAWFGTTLAALRFQRPLGALWHGGLLYGLLTRVDVEQALSGQPEGVFVLRFSETNAGQLGVAYVGAGAQGTRVRHYLITPADVLGNKRTVCDFLMEQQQFQTLLLYGVDANGAPTFTPVAKRIAFKEFVKAARSAPDSSDAPDGYEPLQ